MKLLRTIAGLAKSTRLWAEATAAEARLVEREAEEEVWSPGLREFAEGKRVSTDWLFKSSSPAIASAGPAGDECPAAPSDHDVEPPGLQLADLELHDAAHAVRQYARQKPTCIAAAWLILADRLESAALAMK